ncbi:hypothetical protein ODJ79_39735 [Actinoplanes sp. KI2]|uniref:hypothetical protein n=1 Tax=Actinoplanes sp. KI2 TaxID=2983315 RepID=UPI0021D58509|nr:hypothetical protein [Actinoplanes sp. KI2]MCU7729884.1 hypothetical protein [Actinoplanes sp. KI2]
MRSNVARRLTDTATPSWRLAWRVDARTIWALIAERETTAAATAEALREQIAALSDQLAPCGPPRTLHRRPDIRWSPWA